MPPTRRAVGYMWLAPVSMDSAVRDSTQRRASGTEISTNRHNSGREDPIGANLTHTPIMWNTAKVDRLERELDAATDDAIIFHDPDTNQDVPILCTYGRYLVEYLNEQLTIPLAERQHAN